MDKNTSRPNAINIADFDYLLPDTSIAKYPLNQRDSSKLLVYRNKTIEHSTFKHLPDFLDSGDVLFFNNTKVIPARLKFAKETGAQIEIFCLEPLDPTDYILSFQSHACTWKCIVGNLKRWKGTILEKKISIDGKEVSVFAEKIADHQTSVDVRFTWNNEDITFEKIIENTGVTPIPPYLNRESEDLDKTRYQTIYSQYKGSVAAPTAGLHFTEEILKSLSRKNIATGKLTLHVGAGTFKPVQSETIAEHEMHTEFYTISRPEIEQLIRNYGNIVAVGTTTLRSLESLYFSGLKLHLNEPETEIAHIRQWDPYDYKHSISYTQALEEIVAYLNKKNLDSFTGYTQIMIVPGYKPQSIKALLTNFHQPKSTLLLLIASIVGNDWQKIYRVALDEKYRFLSYGDSSLLFL